MDIIVLGAGYGGITAALRLARLFRHHPGCRVHLIDRNPYHTLKTRLHEAAIRKTGVVIPIKDIIKGRQIRFHPGNVTRIDPGERKIFLDDRVLAFDYLVIALGSEANFYNIPGLEEHSFPLQSADDAQRIHRHISLLCALAAQEADPEARRNLLRFVIGGGGLSGVEFAAELAEHAALCVKGHGTDRSEVEVILIEKEAKILWDMEPDVTARIEQKLREKGVLIRTGCRITALTSDTVTLATGERLRTAALIWTGGIMVNPLTAESGLKTGQMGRIVVDRYLRAADHPYIYAIGDNALATHPETGRPLPAAAQFALQQGRLVAANIHAVISNGQPLPYRPKVFGEIVSLGRHLAIGWMALPFVKKITFFGFLGRLLKTAVAEKHIFLLRKESRHWIAS